jgi:hypothetical protein
MIRAKALWANTQALRSLRVAMVAALALSLFAQLGHTAAVFAHLAHTGEEWGQAHAYAFALAVELSVLLFVLAGHKRISALFALATFLTNVSYYYIALDGAWYSADAVFAVLMSLLLPGVILGYSHIIAHGAQTAQTVAHSETQADEDGADEDEEEAQTQTVKVRRHAQAAGKTTAHQRRLHIKESGLEDAAQIAQTYRVSVRTAQDDLAKIREGLVTVNGYGQR